MSLVHCKYPVWIAHKLLILTIAALSLFLFAFGHVIMTSNEEMKDKFGKDDHLDTALNDFKNAMPKTFPEAMRATVEEEVDISILLRPLGVTLVSFGAVACFWSIIGIVLGLISRLIPELLLYLLRMLGCAIISTSAICTYLVIEELTQEELLELLPDYKGLAGTEQPSLILNTIMQGFGCCGIHSYSDFKDDVSGWPPDNFDFSVLNNVTKLIPKNPKFQTPLACCRNASMTEFGCFVEGVANEANNYMNTGCLDALFESGVGSLYVLGSALLTLAILLLIEIVVAGLMLAIKTNIILQKINEVVDMEFENEVESTHM